MKTESRPAKVGERIMITRTALLVGQHYEVGDILTVLDYAGSVDGDIYVEGTRDFIDYLEYEVVV